MFTTIRINAASRRAAATSAGLVLAVTLAVALAAITVLPSLVRAADPISVELLTSRAQFTDQVDAQIRFSLDGGPTTVLNMPDASRTLVARFTVQPGAQFPWHTHPGPVIVNIAQGELVYVQASDCVERGYPAGTVFIDPGRGNVHSAYNPSDSVPTIVVATFLDFPADGPLTIADANQAHCAMQGGAHAGH
jgi:quercetin dioxygenase-like cupin family protein